MQTWGFSIVFPCWKEPAEVVQASCRHASRMSAWGGNADMSRRQDTRRQSPVTCEGLNLSSVPSSQIGEVAGDRRVWTAQLKSLSADTWEPAIIHGIMTQVFVKSIFWMAGSKRMHWFSSLFVAPEHELQRPDTPARHFQTRKWPQSKCELGETCCDYVHQIKFRTHWCRHRRVCQGDVQWLRRVRGINIFHPTTSI